MRARTARMLGCWVEAGRGAVDVQRGVPYHAAAVRSNTAGRMHESERKEEVGGQRRREK